MPKDPAFLFYPNDFMSGTQFFTDEQVGKYIRLLIAQHQIGHLEEKHMLQICKTYDKDIFFKFVKDINGKFYNERLDYEIYKRKKYTESRSKNRTSKKNISSTYEKHMENENRIILFNTQEEEKKEGGLGETKKFLADEMLKIFFSKNPTDLPNDFDDKKNCWSVAQKIEKAKGWELQSSLNGKFEDCLTEWSKILDFVAADEFFKKFSLKNLDSQFSAIWKNYSQKKSSKIGVDDTTIRGVEFLENFTKVRMSDGSVQELGRNQSEMAKFNEISPNYIWKGLPKN